jgi:hypothetical protein
MEPAGSTVDAGVHMFAGRGLACNCGLVDAGTTAHETRRRFVRWPCNSSLY